MVKKESEVSSASEYAEGVHRAHHLNEEIDSESPLWSAAGELCHSFQTCCCQLALKKTHFQPT